MTEDAKKLEGNKQIEQHFIAMANAAGEARWGDEGEAEAILDTFKQEWQALSMEQKKACYLHVYAAVEDANADTIQAFLDTDGKPSSEAAEKQNPAPADEKQKEEPDSAPANGQAAVVQHPRYGGIPRVSQEAPAHAQMAREEISPETQQENEKNLRAFLQKSNAEIKPHLKPGENHVVHRNLEKGIPHTLVYAWDETAQTHQAYIVATTQDKPALHLSLHHNIAPEGRTARVKSIFSFNAEEDLKPILSGQPSPFIARTVRGLPPKCVPGEINIAERTYGCPIPVIAYDNRAGNKKYMEILPRARGHNLAETPADGRKLTVVAFFQMVRACLEAIRDFHAQGFVHNDLHQGNIFYSKENGGIAQLIDFDYSANPGATLEATLGDIRCMAGIIHFMRAHYAPPQLSSNADFMLYSAYTQGRIQDRDLLPYQRLQLSLDALCKRMDVNLPHEHPTAEEALKELDAIYTTFAEACAVENKKDETPSNHRQEAGYAACRFFTAPAAVVAADAKPAVVAADAPVAAATPLGSVKQ